MGPQCEDGYTKIANELLEALCLIRIPGESMQIFLTILRKTYGFGKKIDRIALSQFTEATGIRKTHVLRAIQKLEQINIIVTQKGNVNNTTYEINKHYTSWQSLPKKGTYPIKGTSVPHNGNEVTQKGNKSNPKRDIQKKERNLTKETITKEIVQFEICIAWKAFVEMRKTIKKPMTPYAMQLRANDLKKLQDQGQDPIAVLNQSVASNYQDLYPVKEKSNGSDRPTSSPKTPGRKTGIIEANKAGTDFLS